MGGERFMGAHEIVFSQRVGDDLQLDEPLVGAEQRWTVLPATFRGRAGEPLLQISPSPADGGPVTGQEFPRFEGSREPIAAH